MSSTGDNVMSSQLLVDMPAQSAARLLTLSLLEQLPQNASALASADPRDVSRYAAMYRSVAVAFARVCRSTPMRLATAYRAKRVGGCVR